MSVLRKIGKAFAGFFFTVALITTIMIFSLVNFTQFDSFKGIVAQIFKQPSVPQIVAEAESAGIIENLRGECQNKETIQARFGLGDVVIDCSELNAISSDNVADFVASTVANNIYYKKYDCDFVSCLRGGEQIMPLIMTELAHNFYKQILNYAIIVTIVLGFLFVLAAEGIKSRLKSLGFSFLWSSVPFFVMSLLLDRLVVQFAPAQILPLVQPILDSFFSPTFTIYMYILVAGIALVVAGYLIKPGMLVRK